MSQETIRWLVNYKPAGLTANERKTDELTRKRDSGSVSVGPLWLNRDVRDELKILAREAGVPFFHYLEHQLTLLTKAP